LPQDIPANRHAVDGAVATPFPLSEMVCGLPVALSVTDTVPLKVPVVVGVKATVILQLVSANTLEPQSLL
jgi:hypothetical protein